MGKLTVTLIVLICIMSLSPGPQAQGDGWKVEFTEEGLEKSKLREYYLIDFTIPDSPAANITNDDGPSDIVTPASTREFVLKMSEFIESDGSFTIPKALSMEFSPGMLIHGRNLTLKAYRELYPLYRLRTSIAAKRETDEEGPSEVGIGLRVCVIDGSDIRRDKELGKDLVELLEKRRQIINDAVESGKLDLVETGPLSPDDPLLAEDPVLKSKLEKIDADIEKKKEEWKEKHWNARTLDFAFAAHASSPDAKGKNLDLDKYALWATYGKGFGTWGQLLVGLNGAIEQDIEDAGRSKDCDCGGEFDLKSFSASTRLYVGTNPYKTFIEVQGATKEGKHKPEWLLNLGGEARLRWGYWVSFSSGLNWVREDKKVNLVTSLNLKLGLPGGS